MSTNHFRFVLTFESHNFTHNFSPHSFPRSHDRKFQLLVFEGAFTRILRSARRYAGSPDDRLPRTQLHNRGCIGEGYLELVFLRDTRARRNPARITPVS